MSNTDDIFAPAPPPKTPLQRYRILSPKASIRVSPIQLGGMSIGSAWTNQLGSMNKEQSFKMLDEYFNAGGNFIDTSSNYQNEESETWIGSWMAERKNREQIVLATKYTTDYRSYALGRGNAPNAVGNSKRNMFRSVEASLRKLQTDYIDILYLHWWDHVTSIEEVMDALHILVQQGKVLYLGISDTPAWVVSAANTYAIAHGKTPFVIYQGRWNVMLRDFERDILPMARHFGLALAPWDVLGGGHFQTAKQIAQRKKDGEGLRPLRSSEQNEAEVKMSEALGVVASEHGIESVTAIALAYVLSKAPNVFPIIGGRKVEHLQDNIRAVEIRLTKKQIEYLESVQDFDIGFPGNFIGTDPRTNGGEGQRLAQTAGKVDFVLAPAAVGYEGRE